MNSNICNIVLFFLFLNGYGDSLIFRKQFFIANLFCLHLNGIVYFSSILYCAIDKQLSDMNS